MICGFVAFTGIPGCVRERHTQHTRLEMDPKSDPMGTESQSHATNQVEEYKGDPERSYQTRKVSSPPQLRLKCAQERNKC